MSTHASVPAEALYYPFHLCHQRTLDALLRRFHAVHFRDYMALQLTPLSGTTAYQDRMGDLFPELVSAGRLIQGYAVSGPLPDDIAEAVNRDLADPAWRCRFHEALCVDRRFQRGLFDLSHAVNIGTTLVPGPAALLLLLNSTHRDRPYTVETVGRLSLRRSPLSEAYAFEYGLALVKTSAALAYTLRLCAAHQLVAATDSPAHDELLARSCAREHIALRKDLVDRQGY